MGTVTSYILPVGGVRTAMAIGALVVAATAVAGATAGERPARAPAAVAAFVTPTPNQLVPIGTEVAGGILMGNPLLPMDSRVSFGAGIAF